MSTLTKFSAIPETGPAPTNREPYLPTDAAAMDARGAELAATLPGVEQETGQDLPTLIVPPETIVATLTALKSAGYTMPLDLWGVDYPGRDRRFDVMYQLYSLAKNERVRLKVRVGEDESVPTGTGVFKGLNWYEREVFDMYGVRFDGHPNLRRILTHEAFQGHALRKDYDPAQRWILTEKDIAKIIPKIDPRFEGVDTDFERVTLNLGPSHPATHGTLRIVVTLDGETIIGCDQEIGYLHRCFEKSCETHTYQQAIPFTDRLNYMSAIINNVGYCMAVEKLLGVTAPPRAQHIRLMLCELMRIADHLVCLGTNLVDMGALTNFWYLFQPREEIYGLIEACCGARLLPSYTRIGGLAVDAPPDFLEKAQRLVDRLPKHINDVEKLVDKNKIFLDRVVGVAPITPELAIEYGFTGPCLRACGVPYDVRKASPYLGYETYDFDVPIAEGGDTFARYLVRMEEMRQSLKIIRQALDILPEKGPVSSDDWHVVLPPKDAVYHDMESLIYHFKLIMEGIRVPPGERYEWIEGGNGELGFYAISTGGAGPYRLKVRPPCFPNMAAFEKIIAGGTISDAIATLGTLNVIAGELDR